ncbi:MAG TPA: hybrid sensor histidine kinase/response regulator [Vicinamibacterales bacterium]|nr:hybrid sensor histidine kinase/response regulator [Vicinamibacterales bacterium]
MALNSPPGRILIVDDNDASRYARMRWLADAGHTVFEADRLGKADVLVREVRPDLVVLDINLPDGSGLDYCRELKQNEELRTMMVLQMSASFVSNEDHVRGLEAGADAYLTDPVAPAVFVATVAALLRLSRAERALKELLEREQIARAEAEAANRLKDDFLATLSHELRTPLNAIVGWTTLMRTIEMDEEARRRAIEIIERNAKSQAALIEDLLDVSRITQGQLQLAWLTVHVPAIVTAAIDTVRPSADAKGLELLTEITADPRATVLGDPVRLQQVVWNLLSNAVKFTDARATGRGAIRAVVAIVDDFVEVRVSDNGRGIRTEFLPLVFERFRRADAGFTRSEGGLGLGLAIARQLVEMHGGTLTAASEGEDRGATFVVRLPWRPASGARRENANGSLARLAKETRS